MCSETDKRSSQLGKYPSFFNPMCFGLFNGVSLFDARGIFSNCVFPQNKLLLVNNLRSACLLVSLCL